MLDKIAEIQKLSVLISQQTCDDIFHWYHGHVDMLSFTWHKGGFQAGEMPFVREDIWLKEEDAEIKADGILNMLWEAVKEYKIMFGEE